MCVLKKILLGGKKQPETILQTGRHKLLSVLGKWQDNKAIFKAKATMHLCAV